MLRASLTALLGLALLPAGTLCAEEAPKPSGALSLLRQIDEGFVQIFERVAPAVVVIEASKKQDSEEETEEMKNFEMFFKDGSEPSKGGDKDRPRSWRLPQRSEGSGFIMRRDGFILTNHHVVDGAERLDVRLRDGRTLPAKLVGADDKSDIAIIKVEAKDLPVVELGDSDAVRVGQLVCAIGTPFNLDYSFTCGWVSGKGRSNLLAPSSNRILYEDYIQTDAFINPGNSGGPLFDVDGRVIGMNTLINGINRGLAFAIPSNMLAEIGNQLIATGKVQRPWLGIRVETLAANSALRERNSGVESGVVVRTIEPNAPAWKSELQAADLITEVDGVKLSSDRELVKEILRKKIGQVVQLTVWRNGTAHKVPVTTGELPANFTMVANLAPNKPGADPKADGFGLQLGNRKAGGAVVLAIVPDSPAARADIQIDDVITEVESKAITDAAACLAALTAVGEKKKGVLLNLERNGKRTYAMLNE